MLVLGMLAACRDPGATRRATASARLDETLLALSKTGDLPQAEQGFRAAVEIDPTFPNPRYNLGVLAEQREDWDAAVRWFEEYLALDGDSGQAAKARVRLARARTAQRTDKTAAGRRERLFAEALLDAEIFLEAGSILDAYTRAADAMRLIPERPEGYLVGSRALAAGGKFSDATQLALLASVLSPPESRPAISAMIQGFDDAERRQSKLQRAARLSASARHAEAAAVYEEVWRNGEADAGAGIRAALSRARAGERKRAIEILEIVAQSKNRVAAERARRLLRRPSLAG